MLGARPLVRLWLRSQADEGNWVNSHSVRSAGVAVETVQNSIRQVVTVAVFRGTAAESLSAGLSRLMATCVSFLALAERDSGRNRPVVAIIGDGSFQYSVQSLWTAIQLRLRLLVVVLRNYEYCVLKSFAVLEGAPGVPGLDIAGLDIASIAKGCACGAARLENLEAIKRAAVAARENANPTVLEVPISAQPSHGGGAAWT